MSALLATQLAFAPLGDEDRPAAVKRRLRRAIALGLLAEGAALPSEAELATQLGVSTITLRAALAELRAEGYVETRRGKGGGSFVCLPTSVDHAEHLAVLANLDLEDLRDLRDYHVALSGAAAALAAERAKGHVLDRLGRLANAVATAPDAAALTRCDSRFHIEIAAATRSVRLAKAELVVQAEVGPLLWLPGVEAKTPAQAAFEHLELVTAISVGDPSEARVSAERHVASGLNHLIQLRMDQG